MEPSKTSSDRLIQSQLLTLIVIVAGGALFYFRAQIAQVFTPVPTPPCGQSTLEIGSNRFPIKSIQRTPDSALPLPPEAPERVYWVEGTTSNYVFVFNPGANAAALVNAAQAEQKATVTWADCNSTTYTLFAPEPGSISDLALFDQAVSGLTLMVHEAGAAEELVIRGELFEAQVNTISTPDLTQMQAEISVLETTTSANKATIQVSISIWNYGQNALTLSAEQVTLTPLDTPPLILETSTPPLPKDIAPGATETFTLVFPRPATATAILHILNVEYELDNY